jgi:hypothetical protein
VKIKTELFMVSKVERDSKMEGRRMTLVLQPDHKLPGAKMPGQAGTTPVAGKASTPFTAGSGLNIQRPPVAAAVPTTKPVATASAQPVAQVAPAGTR